MASPYGTFAFSPPTSSSSSSIFHPEAAPPSNLTPTAETSQSGQAGDVPLSYQPYSISPHDVHSSVQGPQPSENELNEHPSFHPSSSAAFEFDSFSPNLNEDHHAKPTTYSPYSYPDGPSHEGGGSGEGDGFGGLVQTSFLDQQQGTSMTAFGSLPAFDQNSILAHRSSFDPPTSASSFASSQRPNTASGASVLLQLSRGGAVYGSSAFYPEEGAAMGAAGNYQMQGGGRYAGGSFSSAGGSGSYGGDDERRRSSTAYDPSFSGPIPHQYPPQQSYHPIHYQQDSLSYHPSFVGTNGTQTQPSFSDLDPSASSSDNPPPFYRPDPSSSTPNISPSHHRASESHHLHQDNSNSPFYPQNSAAFSSPSNASPLATTHQYSSSSTTSTPQVLNPNLRISVPERRPSSSSSASRRPSGSSHAVSYDSSGQQQQFSGRSLHSAQTQRMPPHHPYAQVRRRESVGMASSSSLTYWDQATGGPIGMGDQSFNAIVGGPVMRPQTSDGIPGSASPSSLLYQDFERDEYPQTDTRPPARALHDYSAVPNFFRPPGPTRATTGTPTLSASISPRNLTRPPYSSFGGNPISPSGSTFPLQQPIFAPPPNPNSRRSSNAVPLSSSISSLTSSTPLHQFSPGTDDYYSTTPLARPSTAPSLGMSSRSSSNPVAPRESGGLPPPRPLPPQELLTSLPSGQIRALVRASKNTNISPVTGRAKRPRRKHEEVERLYDCLAEGCGKAYGTLNHLNQHILTQGHGIKRQPIEFRDLRRQWRQARKAANSAAGIKKRAKGEKAKKATKERDGRPTSSHSSGASTGPLGRRRSSGTSGGNGEDDDESDSDEDYSDGEEQEPALSVEVDRAVLPHPLLTGASSVFASSSASPSNSVLMDSPQYSPAPHSFHYHRLARASGPSNSADSPSPLDPHLPFYSGGPPSSTGFSPHQGYSPYVPATPDFNHWAFNLMTDVLPSTPNSRGFAHAASTGYSPLGSSVTGALDVSTPGGAVSVGIVSPPTGGVHLETAPAEAVAMGRGGRPRRVGVGARRSNSVSYTTIEEGKDEV